VQADAAAAEQVAAEQLATVQAQEKAMLEKLAAQQARELAEFDEQQTRLLAAQVEQSRVALAPHLAMSRQRKISHLVKATAGLLTAAVLSGYCWIYFSGRTESTQTTRPAVAKVEPPGSKEIQADETPLHPGMLKLSKQLKQP